MAAARLADELAGPADGHAARRRAARAVQPDPAVGRARGHPRRATASRCRCADARRPAPRRPGRRDPPRTSARSSWPTAPGCRTTRWCWPPAASRPCRRSAAWSGSTAGWTSGCTRSGASTTACGSTRRCRRRARAVVVGGGLLGLQVARALARARPRGRGRRGRRAPAAQPGRRQGRRDPGPRPAPARHQPSTPAPGPPGSPTTGWSSTTATCSRPTWSCSPPAAGRRPRWPAGPAWRYAAASSSTTSCAPATRTSTRSATAPSTAARSPGSCRRPGSRPGCWPGSSTARTHATTAAARVARLRATGLDVAVLGDPERTEGEVVEVSNPVVGSHRRLVVRDGVVVAATLVGDLSRVGLITQHFDRRHGARPGRARRAAHARPARRCRASSPTTPRSARARASAPARLRALRARSTRPARPPAPPPAAAAAPTPSASSSLSARPHPGRNPRMSPHLRRTLVVVGHGMVGHRFVQAAIERGLTETHDVVVIGEEPRPAYDRVALTSFFEVGADALSLLPEGAYDDPRVELRARHRRRGVRPGDADGAARRRPGARVRRARAGHRRGAVRAAGARPRAARLLRLPDHRGPRGDPRGRGTAPGSARSSAAGCSVSRPPTRWPSWAWRRTSSRWRRG